MVAPAEPVADSSRIGSSRGRLVALILLVAVVVLALGVLELPNLDGVREDVAIETSTDAVRSGIPAAQVTNCFQGFCFEDDAGTLERWWRFSSTYLRLTWIVLTLGLIAAALAELALIGSGDGATNRFGFRMPGLRGKDLVVPRRFGTSPEAVGALNAPALAFGLIAVSPLVLGVRVGLALVVLALAWRLLRRDHTDRPPSAEVADGGEWTVRGAVAVFGRYAGYLVPGFVIAAAIGGIATQYLTEEGVAAVIGDHLLGISLAALIGAAIRLPMLLEFPLVAAGLLIGMGRVAAAVLLFTAALGGPLLAVLRQRSRMGVTALVVVVSVLGGLGAVAVVGAVDTATIPTIAFDGSACSYSGPLRFAPSAVDFTIRNDTEDGNDGLTLAIVIGRLPDNVSIDHFDLTVSADRTADLPIYFSVTGNQEFVFPGMEVVTPVVLERGGRYAAVCLYGGGFYVIREFSMPQGPGWFDEFRSLFDGYVAPQVFTVAE